MEKPSLLHTLDAMKSRASRAENHSSRRRGGNTIVVKKESKKKKVQIYRSSVEMQFLQFLPLARGWALSEHPKLKSDDLDILLHINPIGIFGTRDYKAFSKYLKPLTKHRIDRLISEGWISVWRKKRGNMPALYCVSQKGKLLCASLHKMCLGEKAIPEAKKTAPRTLAQVKGAYYTSILEKMAK